MVKYNSIMLRDAKFAVGEYYHIYNCGVEKRSIVLDKDDSKRFIQSICMFNTLQPIGSIYESAFPKNKKHQLGSEASKLVRIIAFNLLPNHFHFILSPISEKGIEKFMQRLGTGYTNYFNNRYSRTGALFQGVFKSIHVGSDEYLLHLSAYINLNDKVHRLGSEASKLARSSWDEYFSESEECISEPDIVLKQFRSLSKYKQFALEIVKYTVKQRDRLKELYIEDLEAKLPSRGKL